MSDRLTHVTAFVALALFAQPASAQMRLSSPDVESGILEPDQVLAGFGCDGANRSPALAWTGAPKGTASFVVSAYDPDAPTGSGFWHWSVFNIPASATFLPEGAGQIGGGRLPEGSIQARNDLSLNAYSGACPPPGRSHRYIFTVFAMPEAVLPLDETASAALVGFFANTSALGRASLMATYGRAE